MKAFVTGGAGFIGSHIVDTLIAHKHHVTVFDNLSSGYKQFIDHHTNNPHFTFIQADLTNPKAITKALPGHDTVFHIAANPDVRRGADEP
ncbi:MAG: SDR family NAD(P)-dependent oxidoreductase, partial [Candidatus Thermoplasmatota archaeon]|nr:SDR family NAD(P)-dependent oxidoreductase [Candidatus Thermoplasmatota archaeon]